jgi:hypothetical protein
MMACQDDDGRGMHVERHRGDMAASIPDPGTRSPRRRRGPWAKLVGDDHGGDIKL